MNRPALERTGRQLAIVATVTLTALGLGIMALTLRAVALGWHGEIGQDLDVYLGYTRQWLAGEGWYDPAQLAGPYVVEAIDGNVYPPVLLYLTVPFALGVPAFLWWAVPLGIVCFTLYRHRPAWWAWPVLALAFAYPRTSTLLVTGNPSMWAIAFAVAGVAWKWPAVFAALKLTLGPLALIGIRHRSWWLALGIALLLCVPFGSLWLDYASVLRNTVSDRGIPYVMGEWPIALALVAVTLSGSPLQQVGSRAQRSEDEARGARVVPGRERDLHVVDRHRARGRRAEVRPRPPVA